MDKKVTDYSEDKQAICVREHPCLSAPIGRYCTATCSWLVG